MKVSSSGLAGTELKNWGLQDILIVCIDGLKGFPGAINTVYLQARIQLCIVHMVCNGFRFVSWKDYKAIAIWKTVCVSSCNRRGSAASTGDMCLGLGLQISRSWISNQDNLNTFFAHPADGGKVIDTANTIESLNSVGRQTFKIKKGFPGSVKKVVWLGLSKIPQRKRQCHCRTGG